MKIYCISLLRVCDKGIRDFELKEAYETSFLSELYPGVSLSKNTVSTFLNDLGKTMSRIVTFMRNRTASVSLDHHLLVDGTLKSDESKVNSLSRFFQEGPNQGDKRYLCSLRVRSGSDGAGLLQVLSRKYAGCHFLRSLHQGKPDHKRDHRWRQRLPGIRSPRGSLKAIRICITLIR